MDTPMLDAIKKTASREENTGINPYLATGAGMALTGTATKMLDPRTTLYHGSSVENMKNIMAQGLKPAGAPGVTEIVVSAYDPQAGAAAKKLVYLTKFKPLARGYAYQSEQLSKIKNPSVFDVLGIQASATPGELAKTKPLKFRLPKTEEFKAMSRVNPEIAVAKDKISLLRGLGDNIGARQQAIAAKLLELDSKPLAGTVSPKYIVGNTGYQKVSPKEIIRYIRANPAKGIGALALGATGIGAIGYGLSRLLRGKKEDPSMPIIEEPKSASLGRIANKASLGLGALGSLATIAYSAAYLSDRAERRRWERRIEENLAENPPQKSKPGSKAHEQSPMGQLRALIPESTPMVIVQAAPESVKTSSARTPMLDEIRKLAFAPWHGALIGGTVGAGIGAVADDENRVRNALIGLGSGALVGGLGTKMLKGRASSPAPTAKPIPPINATAKTPSAHDLEIERLKGITEHLKNQPPPTTESVKKYTDFYHQLQDDVAKGLMPQTEADDKVLEYVMTNLLGFSVKGGK